MTLTRFVSRVDVQSLALFALSLIVLLLTMAPSIHYHVDSPEFVVGARTLSFVHPPGYPLYLLTAHPLTRLFDDPAYGINLYSALALALTVPLLFNILRVLLEDRIIAAGTSLVFVWSFYVWTTGVAAEIYAPQIATFAAVLLPLAALTRQERPRLRTVYTVGALYGVAVAMHPGSGLLALGLVAAFLLYRVPLHHSALSGLLAVVIFLLPLLYFPIRFQAGVAFNQLGAYDVTGQFIPLDFTRLENIWWVVNASGFGHYFLAEGPLLSVAQLMNAVDIVFGNVLWVGGLVGIVGLVVTARADWRLLVVWLAFFVPHFYFFASYGAGDSFIMFGPSHLLWALMIGAGLWWFLHETPPAAKAVVVLLPALAMLAINYPTVDASDDTLLPDMTRARIEAMPADALVVGRWTDIIQLEYEQIINGQRPDLDLININNFFYSLQTFETFMRNRYDAGETIVITDTLVFNTPFEQFIRNRYALQPIYLPGVIDPYALSEGSVGPFIAGYIVTSIREP